MCSRFSVSKNHFPHRRDCRGEHCSPGSLTWQRISGKATHAGNEHGRTLCAPTEHFFNSLKRLPLCSRFLFCVIDNPARAHSIRILLLKPVPPVFNRQSILLCKKHAGGSLLVETACMRLLNHHSMRSTALMHSPRSDAACASLICSNGKNLMSLSNGNCPLR